MCLIGNDVSEVYHVQEVDLLLGLVEDGLGVLIYGSEGDEEHVEAAAPSV